MTSTNGTIALTATGAGYSRWQDIAVTRWREDATRDDWGSFLFLKDSHSGKIWSAGAQPADSGADHDEVFFGEDHAQFVHRDGSLTTTTDILVSSEDDGEVRRVSVRCMATVGQVSNLDHENQSLGKAGRAVLRSSR